MIPEEKVAEVRERTDLVALVQEYVTLKKVGTSFKGLCPFHNEKSPSFHVHPARGFFYCFGCQASGDAIRFLMTIEGRAFPDAVRALAERGGIEIPAQDPAEDQQQHRARKREQRRVGLMEAATDYFRSVLRGEAEGAAAREELVRRGITDETAEAFRLGCAPLGWDYLGRFLADQGWSASDAEELGLLAPRRSGRGHYDRFRHRLMFPITDHQGRIVAFSGRMLPPPQAPPHAKPPANQDVSEGGAKYVNSPEGPLYRKGKILYGLFEGRVAIRREGWVILCEGNFDLVAMHQAGFSNAVAPMGTALTVEQAQLIRRYCDRVVFLFDGDNAGMAAVRKAAPLLSSAGLAARVATLPAGEDPDGFLRSRGPEALQALLDTAPGMVEHLIDEAADRCGADASAKSQAIAGLGPLLMQVGNPVETQLYVERVAQKFGISNQGAVREQLRRGVRSRRRERNGRQDGVRARPEPSRRVMRDTLPSMECELVGALLDNPSLFGSGVAQKLSELLTSTDLRAILLKAGGAVDADGALNAPALCDGILEDEGRADENISSAGREWLKQRLAVPRYDAESAQGVVKSGVVRLELQSIQQELPMLSRKIIEAQRHGNVRRADELLREREALRGAALKLQALKPQAKG